MSGETRRNQTDTGQMALAHELVVVKNMSQRKVAKNIGVGESTLRKWLKDRAEECKYHYQSLIAHEKTTTKGKTDSQIRCEIEDGVFDMFLEAEADGLITYGDVKYDDPEEEKIITADDIVPDVVRMKDANIPAWLIADDLGVGIEMVIQVMEGWGFKYNKSYDDYPTHLEPEEEPYVPHRPNLKRAVL